jgi:hypothetical protein
MLQDSKAHDPSLSIPSFEVPLCVWVFLQIVTASSIYISGEPTYSFLMGSSSCVIVGFTTSPVEFA